MSTAGSSRCPGAPSGPQAAFGALGVFVFRTVPVQGGRGLCAPAAAAPLRWRRFGGVAETFAPRCSPFGCRSRAGFPRGRLTVLGGSELHRNSAQPPQFWRWEEEGGRNGGWRQLWGTEVVQGKVLQMLACLKGRLEDFSLM